MSRTIGLFGTNTSNTHFSLWKLHMHVKTRSTEVPLRDRDTNMKLNEEIGAQERKIVI